MNNSLWKKLLKMYYFRSMILVTGSTGLVGSHLLYKLVSNNETVRAIYRSEGKLAQVKNVFSCYTDDSHGLFEAIEWVQADILDIPLLSEAFNGVSHVYHCAAFVSFEPDKYPLLRQTNIEGTANVVNLCIANYVEKLCYVSTIATLGNPINNSVITEKNSWNPEADNSLYAITKYGAEMEVWRATHEGLNVVVVNPGVIIGGGIWDYGSGSLFKIAFKGLRYYTAGSIGLVAVEDVVTIMTKLLKSDIKNERFILVAENWSYKKFLQALAKSLKVKPPEKMAVPWLLKLAWKLDWLRHKLTGDPRELTRHLAISLVSKTNYNSEKIKTQLNYKFKPLDESIMAVGNQFLKQA